MAMYETENITVWLSLANTVFASIAFMLWYFSIWQEEEGEKLDSNKVVIVDTDDCGICEEDTDNSDEVGEVLKNNGDKHLYVKPNLRNGENLLNYHDYCCYNQTTAKSGQDDIMQTKRTETVQVKSTNSSINHVEDADTKITWAAVVNRNPNTQKSYETMLAKHTEATFQWPKHENAVETLRRRQETFGELISEELQEKLKSFGILRDPETIKGVAPGSLKISDSARMTAKLMDKKKLRITWDNFQAKSRPGLDSDNESPRQRKSNNYQRKNKNSKQSRSDKAGELNWRLLPSLKPSTCMDTVRSA